MKTTSSVRQARGISVGDRYDSLVVTEVRGQRVICRCDCEAHPVTRNANVLRKPNRPPQMCGQCRKQARGQRDFRVHFVGKREFEMILEEL